MDRGRWQLGRSLVALAALVGLGAVAVGALSREVARCPQNTAAVVLDPGHGGVDPGALNESYGLVEAELTLVVAEQTAAILRANGYAVALTRTDNGTALGNSARGAIANACGALVFVSIHLNSFADPAVNYAKTFWATEATDAAFAETMNATLVAALQPGTDLGDGGTGELLNGGLLRAAMPAALVEPVFLSNPEEAARLVDPSGARLAQIARAIATGVERWLTASR